MKYKRFISGAICPKCESVDTIAIISKTSPERIECSNCDFIELKQQIKNNEIISIKNITND